MRPQELSGAQYGGQSRNVLLRSHEICGFFKLPFLSNKLILKINSDLSLMMLV